MDSSLPGSSVRGISQARILGWVAMPSPPGDLPNPGTEPVSPASPALAGGFLGSTHTLKGIYTYYTYIDICVYILIFSR